MPVWRDRNSSMPSKLHLLRSLVITVLLYAAESWTMPKSRNASTLLRSTATEDYLNNHYTSHTTDIKVREPVVQYIGRHDSLPTVAKNRKLRWFRQRDNSQGNPNAILQGAVEGNRKRGRPKRIWMERC